MIMNSSLSLVFSLSMEGKEDIEAANQKAWKKKSLRPSSSKVIIVLTDQTKGH